MATMHGATIMRWAPTLKFGTSIIADANPTMFILPPSEYFVTVPGFKELSNESDQMMPTSITSLLESWTVDTSKNFPQYIINPNYIMKQPNGNNLNGLTVLMQKNFAQNNLRILLHGGDSPTDTDKNLFYIDIDEENM